MRIHPAYHGFLGVGWYSQLDPSRLDPGTKLRVLRYAVEKYGQRRVLEALGVSRYTLNRYLNKRLEVPDERFLRLFSSGLVSRSEFESLVAASDRLRALGILGEDGGIDYGLALEVLALAKNDEYLKNAILRFVAQEFREDLKKMLGLSLAGVKLEWSEDFEHYLRERKKRRKVLTEEQLRKYRNLFKRELEGKELSEELVEQIARHKNGWLRNVFRHYIRYLYHKRRISGETMAWILEVVPSRSYKLDIRVYPINLEELRKTLEHLRQNHRGYYALYRLMLESGARLEHALRMLAVWRPEEQVEIPGYGFTPRLVCPEQGFCRYYLGLREGNKPCEWLYLAKETLELLRETELLSKQLRRELVTRYAKRHGLIRPKYLRKIAWQLMRKTMGYEAAAFAQSRFGELRVSERRYSDLLGETDEKYQKYILHIFNLLFAS